MKIIISFLLFLHLVSMHVVAVVAAVVYLPRLRVYPSTFRTKIFHEQKPFFAREENCIIVALSSSTLLGQKHPSAFDSVFLLLGAAFPPILSVYRVAFFQFIQVRRLLPSVNISTDVMRWFSFLGWYP